jgi:porin
MNIGWLIAPGDLAGLRCLSNWRRGPGYAIGLALAALLGLPPAAKADCDVPDISNGMPGDAAMKIDLAGSRAAAAKAGIGVGGTYYGETFYNWGGFKQGGAYDGVLDLHLDADMKKLGLWKGLCFHMNAFQIHGRSITADDIGSLMPVSNLEATPATRLDEMYLEQHLFNNHLRIKIGQLAADTEFILSESYSYFLNGTWGWPAIAAADLPSGGPAYPLATPGVLVALKPNDRLKLMVGVYNGDPAEPNCPDPNPQVCNSDGLDFSLDSPPLLMMEGRYKYNQSGELPGVVKIGGWNHFGAFSDQRLDSGGIPIAVTENTGRPIDDDWSIYGIIDQLIWRLPGSEDPKGVSLFGRVAGAPTDQNLVDFYAEGGITFTGMIPHRADDALGVGFAYTGISNRVRGFNSDSGLSGLQNYEAVLEICYTAQLRPGWTLQPDFQYFFQPGGNVPGLDNATVLGARTSISF